MPVTPNLGVRFLLGGTAAAGSFPEPVTFLRNDYHKDVRNASLGTVVSLEAAVECDFDGRRHVFSGHDLADLSLAYAMTVHKSQGSQFRRVIVPIQQSRILDRTLIYTAITRATEQVVLVADLAALQQADGAAGGVAAADGVGRATSIVGIILI